MKLVKNSSSLFKYLAALALLAGMVLPSQAAPLNIALSGTGQANDQPIIDFLNANFSNIGTITYGDFSNPANIPVGTSILMVGRSLGSGAYEQSVPTVDALTIPIVSFTSFVVRPDSGRWGWESGGVSLTTPTATGSETTVTAAGASVFGVAAGNYDWYTSIGNGSQPGTGTVGGGNILASFANGDILSAGWTTGQLSADGNAFGGNRLLFNAFQNGTATWLPDNAAGQQALISALTFYTPLLQAVPEPASMALVSLGGFALLLARRRRSC